MSDKEPAVTVENALIGLTLTETFFKDDAKADDLYTDITTSHDDDELLAIYAQLATIWAITEAAERGISVPDYMRRLRTRMLQTDTLLKDYNR